MTPRSLLEPARLAGTPLLRAQTDERLVDLTRAGNPRAFEAIVQRYRRPLLRYLSRLLPLGQVEDTLQLAFMRAYEAMMANEAELDLRPWLYRISHNAAVDALRRGDQRSHDQLDESVDGVERPDQAVERSEHLATVLAAVEALPPRQRSAVVLRELEGRSYDEIAAALGVSGGAVKMLLNRARTTLRAGVTALTPMPLLTRLGGAEGESVATRVAEICAGGAGASVLVKAGAAVMVTGAVAGGVAQPSVPGGEERERDRTAKAAEVEAEVEASPRTTEAEESPRDSVGGRTEERSPREDGPRDDDDRRAADDDEDDSSGSGSGDDGDEDNSGPGDGDDLADEDNSGPGSGDDTVDEDRSGPGDGTADFDNSDSSGPGSGDAFDDSDSSGSGSSGSGSSGSGDDDFDAR